jgi:hypothetical protein
MNVGVHAETPFYSVAYLLNQVAVTKPPAP